MTFFKTLWSNYPDSDPCNAKGKDGKKLFANQCAIRMSYALSKSGISLEKFPSKSKCWVHQGNEIIRAKELADWLEVHHFKIIKSVENITGVDWREKILDKTGIICFEDYYSRTEGGVIDGDHIDLWDGSKLTSFTSWLRIQLRIVMPGVWSDFTLSKRIRFFLLIKRKNFPFSDYCISISSKPDDFQKFYLKPQT